MAADLRQERLALGRVADVAAGGGRALDEEGAHQRVERVVAVAQRNRPLDRGEAQLEVVGDDVAAGLLQRPDQPEGRLLAERPHYHHARVVVGARGTLAKAGEQLAQQRGVVGRGELSARARGEIRLGGADAPGLLAPQGLQLVEQRLALVLARDRLRQRLAVERLRPARDQHRRYPPQLRGVEAPAQFGREVLRHVEVGHRLLREEHLPHPREVADHVAGGREDERVERVQRPAQAQLHRAAGQVADVRLEEGIAAHHVQLIAASEDGDGQAPHRLEQRARHVDGQMPHHQRAGVLRLPAGDVLEVQVLHQLSRTLQRCGCGIAHGFTLPRSGSGVTTERRRSMSVVSRYSEVRPLSTSRCSERATSPGVPCCPRWYQP